VCDFQGARYYRSAPASVCASLRGGAGWQSWQLCDSVYVGPFLFDQEERAINV